MPLVYPPNFEGVSLTYEFAGLYFLYSDDLDNPSLATELTYVIGNEGLIELQSRYCFFYFRFDEANRQLLVRGFLNNSGRDFTIYGNSPAINYYTAFCPEPREGDCLFILLRCRMALNGTFSNPIYLRVSIELLATTDLSLTLSWDKVPLCGIFDSGQSEN